MPYCHTHRLRVHSQLATAVCRAIRHGYRNRGQECDGANLFSGAVAGEDQGSLGDVLAAVGSSGHLPGLLWVLRQTYHKCLT